MQLSDIAAALGIAADYSIPSGEVVLASGKLNSNIDNILQYCYNNQPLQIAGAKYTAGDTNSFIITGTATYQQIAALPVSATFYTDANGDAQLLIRYQLPEINPGQGKWRFSNSFPGLPQVLDNTQPINFDRVTEQVTPVYITPLDTLTIYNAYFVVTSEPQQDTSFHVPLQWGLNFTANVKPDTILALVETIFQSTTDLVIFGTIWFPNSITTPASYAAQHPFIPGKVVYPWEIAADGFNRIPGICLQIPLQLSYNVQQNNTSLAAFAAESIYFYTPPDDTWIMEDTSPALIPLQAYTGSISIDNSAIKADITAPVQYGIDELVLYTTFEGLSIGNLTQLAGITGSADDPLQLLPDGIQHAVKDLQLMNLSLALDYSYTDSIALTNTSFTIGMPGLNWNIWPGDHNSSHLELDSISCTFSIDNPFSIAPELYGDNNYTVTVNATLEIENVPFTVTASSGNNFTIYAQMAEQETIPLQQILQAYAPQIPAPSDLTVDTFRVSATPGQSYSFAMLMAAAPNPWSITVGSETLTVSDVSLACTYQNSAISGSIGGIIQLNDYFSLNLYYATPGNIIIRSFVPQIQLSQLIQTFAPSSVTLPQGFDITLTNNSVLLQQTNGVYNFQLATAIAQLGCLLFAIEKTAAGNWGFAAGIAIDKGMLANLPASQAITAFEKWFPFDDLVLIVSSIADQQFSFPGFQQFNNTALNNAKIQLPASANGVSKGFYLYTTTSFTTDDNVLAALMQLLKIPANTQLDVLLAYLADKEQFQLGITLQTFLTPAKDPSQISAAGSLAYSNTTLSGTLFVTAGGTDGFTLGLAATVQTLIQQTPVTFNVTLAMVPNGFFAYGTMKNTVPITIGPVQLANVGLQLGISLEGLPSLGFTAEVAAAGLFDSSIAVLLDSTDPAKCMVAGAISDLRLIDIVNHFTNAGNLPAPVADLLSGISLTGSPAGSFAVTGNDTGNLVTALNSNDTATVSKLFMQYGHLSSFPADSSTLIIFADAANARWYITSLTGSGNSSLITHYQLVQDTTGNCVNVSKEIQFYFVPDPAGSNIGNCYYPQGMMLSGRLNFLFLDLDVDVTCVSSQGINIQAEMAPIIVWKQAFFSITDTSGNKGPSLSFSSYQTSSSSAPGLICSGQMELMGLKESISIVASKSGGYFSLSTTVIPLVQLSLTGNFQGLNNLSVSGSASISIGSADLNILGIIKLTAGISCTLTIGWNGTDASAVLHYEVYISSDTHTGSVTLDVNTAMLTDLVNIIEGNVSLSLSTHFLDNVGEWLDTVFNKLNSIQDIKTIGNLLHTTFNLSGNDIISLTQQHLQYNLDNLVTVLNGAGQSAGSIQSLLQNTGQFSLGDILSAMEKELSGFTPGGGGVPGGGGGVPGGGNW
ncbi:hypothetical protein ECE50_010630 [Chitinophaga sp. Mgbs1]|uniref:Uncharacterized protein n=1 Tax=Chitinophaga solisilvae TaxID=1233460 RepID=A0A3S1DSL8_9BACT|nr:hypothetical protein [Chitinophaga solisilvae]